VAYFLGIDIGTTYTAAAVWRDGRSDVANLGNRAQSIPSVVLLRDDGTVLVGEAAERRAATEPQRVAREFKRRLGDPTPVIVGGTPYSADALIARVLRWVVDRVTELEGGPPARVAVSHPANWGSYKLDLLRQAIRIADLDDVITLSEPEAAAIHYAAQARIEPGAVIAVYDLGGGTFDVAVLRKTGAGWEILGSPEGIERLGGVDFDSAVFHHVTAAIPPAIDELDPAEPAAQAAVARLRQECVEAKEALSSDSDVSIPVLLPNLQTEVRLTRGEYEQMVRPALADTITAVNRALRSAGVAAGDLTSVLLVGGSSRTPLVAELVTAALGRPVAVDAHPKFGVALGAALTAAGTAGALGGPPFDSPSIADATPPGDPQPGDARAAAAADPIAAAAAGGIAAAAVASGTATAGAPGETTPGGPPTGGDLPPAGVDRGRRTVVLVGAGVVAVVGLVALALLVLSGDDDPAATAGPGESTTTVPTTPTTAPPTTQAPEGPFVRIDDVVLDGGRYRVTYQVLNYQPDVDDPDALHIHFFLDTTAPEDAGFNGDPVGDWDLTDEPNSFTTKYGPGDRGDAGQMCSAVATHAHDVFEPATPTGNCVALPD
jgi:molecular chaperone DnaK